MIELMDLQEFRLREGVITKMFGDEMVLLDYERGIYYGLNDVGARMLSLIAEGISLPEVVERLLEEFEVSGPTLQSDLQTLIGELQAKGLVAVI
jgi:Coenzyme PQQ synthesis protein D (PqqD)